MPLALKALGGLPPLTWLVNGSPVLRNEPRRNAATSVLCLRRRLRSNSLSLSGAVAKW